MIQTKSIAVLLQSLQTAYITVAGLSTAIFRRGNRRMVFETSDISNAECFDFRVGPDFALFKT